MISDLENQNAASAAPRECAESALIAAWILHRDEAAAAQLVRKFLPLVRGIAHRRINCPWLADDAVQDTLSRAFQRLAQFDASRPFAGWLGAIAIRVCHDKLRALARLREVPLDDLTAHPLAPGADDAALAAEKDERIHTLIAALRAEDRDVIRLRYIAGLPAKIVAVRLGITPGSVGLRAMRARRTLLARAAELHARDSIFSR